MSVLRVGAGGLILDLHTGPNTLDTFQQQTAVDRRTLLSQLALALREVVQALTPQEEPRWAPELMKASLHIVRIWCEVSSKYAPPQICHTTSDFMR